ncbi:MAG: ABC transporter ATP-binding protein [Herbaspirillum sp.]
MLKLDHVTIQFGGLTALNNVSFAMGADQLVGLVGANGAGKTTLFNAISGLVRPTRGQIEFNGADISKQPLYARARLGIGRTFQIPQPMHELTVRENLLVAQRFGTGRVDQNKLNQLMEFMDLSKLAERDAATGLALQELKRLEVAKALATEPKLLLLDEVLAGLETNGKRYFTTKLEQLQRQFKIGVLIIEHDIEVVSTLCQRVVVLNFGEVIADGTPEAVFRDPEVMRSYTGAVDA